MRQMDSPQMDLPQAAAPQGTVPKDGTAKDRLPKARRDLAASAPSTSAPSTSAPSTSAQQWTVGGLETLAAEISAAWFEPPRAMGERVKAALRRAAADPAILTPEQRQPCAERYARHVLYSDPSGRFTILAIVWGPGQFSPPHAHHTWCAYAVHDGPLEETLFAWDPAADKARPVRTEVRNPGYGCYAGPGLDQIHRLGNAGDRPAVSIHVYGVERDRIATHVNRMVEASDENA